MARRASSVATIVPETATNIDIIIITAGAKIMRRRNQGGPKGTIATNQSRNCVNRAAPTGSAVVAAQRDQIMPSSLKISRHLESARS